MATEVSFRPGRDVLRHLNLGSTSMSQRPTLADRDGDEADLVEEEAMLPRSEGTLPEVETVNMLAGSEDILEGDQARDGNASTANNSLPPGSTSDVGIRLFEEGFMSIGGDELSAEAGSEMDGISGNRDLGEDSRVQSRGRFSVGGSGSRGNTTANESRDDLSMSRRSGDGRSRDRPRRRGISLGGSGMRSGLSRKFVRSLIRHLCLRADSRQREDLRSMVETLKGVANQPGIDMKQELKREAVSLLGPELAREAFEASITETRNEFLRQRMIAAAAASAAAATTAIGGGQAAANAAAEAATQEFDSSPMMTDGSGGAGSDEAHGGAGVGISSSPINSSGVTVRRVGVPLRSNTDPHPRKRKSLGGNQGADSDGEDGGIFGPGSLSFDMEEIEQRLRAIHKGPQHEDFHLCCVCMDRSRDAAMIHGKTSHQACCYDCASELFERGLSCPWCRQPISCVVRNYL